MVMMELFYDEDGAAYVAADVTLTKDEAITFANKHFHLKKDALDADKAVIRNDELVFNGGKSVRPKDKLVWVVFKK